MHIFRRGEDILGSKEELNVEERKEDECDVSKRKKKKMERNPYKPFSKARANCALCSSCGNPSGRKLANLQTFKASDTIFKIY